MHSPYLWALIGLLFLTLSAAWLWQGMTTPVATVLTPAEEALLLEAKRIAYQNPTGEIWEVDFTNDLARISAGGTYAGTVLRQVVAASGVRYEHEASGLVLWTQGDEMRVMTTQRTEFAGSVVLPPVIAEEVVSPATDPDTIPDTAVAPIEPAATTTMPRLIGAPWVWQRVIVAGAEQVLAQPERFSLTFTADGTVQGATDCNGFGGSYTYEADKIVFSEFMSTLMYCEGSDEQRFTSLLLDGEMVVSALTDSTLTLQNASGAALVFAR